MKRIAAVLCMVMLVCICGNALALKNSDVVGVWMSISMTEAGTVYSAQGDITIELKKNGTIVFPDLSEEAGYTWQIDGEVVYLYNPDGSLSEVTIMIVDGKLLLDDGIYCYTMEKQS